MDVEARPHGPLRGQVRPPGDKSISHRALILAALAAGESTIAGLLEGEDVLATARTLSALGVSVERSGEGLWRVAGVGSGGLAEPDTVLDCGNAGTLARLLLGVLAGHPFRALVTGDPSLRRRPMARVTAPLRMMGATIHARADDRLPLAIRGRSQLIPIAWSSPVASAQVKSAILLAGLHAPGETTVVEPLPSRDHTERMLAALGAQVVCRSEPDGRHRVTLRGYAELRPRSFIIPADPSSAAFPLVAALCRPGSEVILTGVGLNPTRTGLFDALARMGARLAIRNRREEGGEPVADLVAQGSELVGIDLSAEIAPRMIDEYPILAVAAACARGPSVLRGLGELRVKESDRLQAMESGLRACGVQARVVGDDLHIEGTGGRPPPGGGRIDAGLDHRIAMSFLVLGGLARRPVRVKGAETIHTSFPGFLELMNGLGAELRALEEEA